MVPLPSRPPPVSERAEAQTGVVLRQGTPFPQTAMQKLEAARALLTRLPAAHPRRAMLRLAITRRDQALLSALLLELDS